MLSQHTHTFFYVSLAPGIQVPGDSSVWYQATSVSFVWGSNLSKCALTHFDDKYILIYKLLDIISSETKFLLCSKVYALTLVL